MEFKIPRPARVANMNISRYANADIELARKFSKRSYDEFGTFIKAVVLFGSSARKTEKRESDVDILIVIDDLSVMLSPELVQTYRIIIEKMILETSKRLHVTTLKYSSFWDYARVGDPVAINILRDGVALIDTGFFDPLQALLLQGRIRPSPEAIWTYFSRAPTTLHNAEWHVMQGTLDLYWAAIDSAHAALMKVGEIPPSPEHVADLIDEKLVKTGHLPAKYADIMRILYHLSKKIVHRELKSISGAEFDKYSKAAEDFVNTMRKFIEKQK